MSKRANSEGTIYERSDGRWVASVTVLRDGIRKRISRYAATQGDARKLLTSVKKNQDDGRPVDFDKLTFRQWLDIWLSTFIKPNRSPATFSNYHYVLATGVPDDLGKLPLNRIRAEHLQALFSSIAATGHGRTAENLRAVLRAAFGRAVKLQKVPLNPIAGTEPIRFVRKDGSALTTEQADALLKSARAANDRFEPLWVILISLGLRRGEAFGLKPEDIDFEARHLAIQRTLAWVKLPGQKDGHWVEKEPKTLRSRRSYRLPEIAVKAFTRQLAQREAEQVKAGKSWRNAPYVFTSERGGPLHGSNVVAALHAACALAEVPQVRVHDLRHSCGSFLAAQGVALPLIMDILGHTQVATAKRYIHSSNELRGIALDSVGELLAPAKPVVSATHPHPKGKPRSNRVAVTVAVN